MVRTILLTGEHDVGCPNDLETWSAEDSRNRFQCDKKHYDLVNGWVKRIAKYV